MAALAPAPSRATSAPEAAPTLGKPRKVDRLRLAGGPATLQLEGGFLVPLERAGEARPREFLFVGKGRLLLRPAEALEAQQLELFHGEPALDYAFEELALFLPLRPAAEALLRRPEATVDAVTDKRLAELQKRWLGSGERGIAGVELRSFADAQGDPAAQSYFVAWALAGGNQVGDVPPLLYIVDPREREQVMLGRFVKLVEDEREERRIERMLHREQRKGRLLGLRTADLGQFDTWVSTSLSGADGPRPGFEPFEAAAYKVSARIDADLTLHGRAEIELQTLAGGSRVVASQLFSDMLVDEVEVDGQPADFERRAEEVAIALPAPSVAGQPVKLAITYHGALVERVSGIGHALRDPIYWHPHVGDVDRATYDVELRWPKRFDLLAGGVRVDGGETATERWERRKLERPASAFGFELGRFDVSELMRGDVKIRVALDRASRELPKQAREELTAAAADAVELYSGIFGAYPYAELTVVTVPRDFSQSLPGLITLSDLMMADFGIFGLFLGLEDRRTVVAHEVAHQWWGHEVGWESYRDQWLSEALANWSALHYAREKLKPKQPIVGPTAGWESDLAATLADGRRVESVGPVTLGGRLESTRSEGAYGAIVYKKGAIVFDMLAEIVGRERLVTSLHDLFGLAAGKVISTEVLIAALERSTGVSLSGFAQQFVYGTGLPELSFDYTFAPSKPGHWKVDATVRQRLPQRYRYRVEAIGPEGKLDVVRERRGEADVAGWWLMVPFQVAVRDPKAGRDELRKVDDLSVTGWVTGQVLVKGASSPFELEVQYEPQRLWLDRSRQVFATFHDDTRDVKRSRYRQGLEAAAAGDLPRAERLWAEAVAARPADADEPRHVTQELDATIELELARERLDRGDDSAAAAAVSRAADRLGRWAAEEVRGEVDLVQSRLDVRAGRYAEAYRRLRKVVLRRGSVDSAEAHLLLAVAALRIGEREAFVDALEAATERGADVKTLRELAAKAPAS